MTAAKRSTIHTQIPAKPCRRRAKPVPKYQTKRAATRRFNALLRQFLAGRAAPTVVEQGLARQAAAVMLRCEQLQAQLVRGEAVDPLALVRTTGELRRALRALGVRTEPEEPIGTPPGLEIARARWAEAEARAQRTTTNGK